MEVLVHEPTEKLASKLACEEVKYKDLRTNSKCGYKLPPLKQTDRHHVLVEVPLKYKEIPSGYPKAYKDLWDNKHVRMPCSSNNLYPFETNNGEMILKNRWDLIQESLRSSISNSLELEEAILKYNTRYADKWDFSGLHTFFTEELEAEETTAFFATTLPLMVNLALQLPHICTQSIPLLQTQKDCSVTMSQQQIACLLSNAFFCTFPRRNTKQKQSEYYFYPDINFNQLFSGSKNPKQKRKMEKLKCLIHYFRRITKKMPDGVITYHRQVLEVFPKWNESDLKLNDLYISSHGSIEDDGQGMLQVDFANKYIGGGVLNFGCVQEEIRFLICPEMIVSRLFTEVLHDNEALIMTGCERFSSYEGYSGDFFWTGNYKDKQDRDDWCRLLTEVVAIDAMYYNNKTTSEQFNYPNVKRELNKAYTGFYNPADHVFLPAVATGNWGCGAFNGNLQLKCLIQLISATHAGRQVCYFTFENKDLSKQLLQMRQFLHTKQLSVGDIIVLINQYNHQLRQGSESCDLFTFIYKVYDKELDSSTEQSMKTLELVKDEDAGSRENSSVHETELQQELPNESFEIQDEIHSLETQDMVDQSKSLT